MKRYLVIFGMVLLSGAALSANAAHSHKSHGTTDTAKPANPSVNTADVCADDLLTFAQTLIGTPYRSAASDPNYGFDCSGFVSYVFKNFNFNVPRSSYEFAGVGERVALQDAKPGDIILFTSPTKRSRRIGHVAIVMTNDADSELTFIHSTSGKEHGVTITTMDDHYKHRFVQIVRLLKQPETNPEVNLASAN